MRERLCNFGELQLVDFFYSFGLFCLILVAASSFLGWFYNYIYLVIALRLRIIVERTPIQFVALIMSMLWFYIIRAPHIVP